MNPSPDSIRAVLFDLDGTLIDSLPDIANALNAALDEVGLSRASLPDVRRWIGDGLVMLCHRAIEHQHASLPLDDFVSRVRAAYSRAPAVETTCFLNIMKMLDLVRASGRRIAVVTNKPHELSDRILIALGLNRRVDALRGYRIDEDRKPSPKMAIELANELGVPAGECIIVGDSPVDIETARRAGMWAAGVTWGYRDIEEIRAARPDWIMDDALGVATLLELKKK